MELIRIKIAVDSNWKVSIEAEGQLLMPMRQMGRARASVPYPLPPASDKYEKGGIKESDEFEQIVSRVSRQAPAGADVSALGLALFRALLGDAGWLKIREQAAAKDGIELGLSFPIAEAAADNLARMNWELMRSDEGPLAAGFVVDGAFKRVVITRLVQGPAAAPTMSLPPRFMFVVGSPPDDERIKAGAEFMSVLRHTRHGVVPRAYNVRVLTRATVPAFEDMLRTFGPDLVHFVCHGTDDGKLEFAWEPGIAVPRDGKGKERPKLLDAKQVAALFLTGGSDSAATLPSIVVLSACHSGRAQGTSNIAPLAEQLIQIGIPVVVGMAGKVADTTCRVFTRGFGEALCAGHPLLVAIEQGRRAAFIDAGAAEACCEWAMPVVYLCENAVSSAFAPTSRSLAKQEEELVKIITGISGIRETEPCFTARVEEFEKAYGGIRRRETSLVVVNGDSEHGRSRFLREIAANAIRDGDMPVFLSRPYRGYEIRDLQTLATHLAEEMKYLSELYGAVGYSDGVHHLDMVAGNLVAAHSRSKPIEPAGLSAEIAGVTTSDQLNPSDVIAALRFDIEALLAAVRSGSAIFGAGSRPIVLLDDIQWLPPEVLRKLFSGQLVSQKGLSPPTGSVIPLVVAFQTGPKMQDTWESVFSPISARWACFVRLATFERATNQDLQAYREVLLHPFNERLLPGYSDRSWIESEKAAASTTALCIKYLRDVHTKAVPSDFVSKLFYEWVRTAAMPDIGVLVEARDDDILKQIRART